MRRYSVYDMPKTGEYVTWDRRLVDLFISRGWRSAEVTEQRTWRVTGSEYDPDFGTVICMVAEPCPGGRLKGVVFRIDSPRWGCLIEARLGLAEKERARMQNEPWVARRDENLSSVFKPEPRASSSTLSGRVRRP